MSENTAIQELLISVGKCLRKNVFSALQKGFSLSWGRGPPVMMEHDYDVWRAFIFALYICLPNTERLRKQCNLSKRKRLRSIEFSLQLCFHTAAEAGCGGLMNETLTFEALLAPPSSLSVLGSQALSLWWCESTRMRVCALGPDSPQCHVPG